MSRLRFLLPSMLMLLTGAFSQPAALDSTVAAALPAADLDMGSGSAAQADSIPDLEAFIRQIQNGQADQLVGVFSPGVFALSIYSQPNDDPYFVTQDPGAVTLFGSARRLGSTGLLAHSHLAGAAFHELQPGQITVIVYGDGSQAFYQISHQEAYQALDPNDPYSTFVSLQDGTNLEAGELFMRIYAAGERLVLQTCIERDGQANWGRLFVIAEPISTQTQTPLQSVMMPVWR